MVVATLLVILFILVLILKLAAKHCTCDGADDTVTTHLVTAKVSRCTTAKRTHQTTVALSLRARVGRAVLLLAGLAVGVVALGILILLIGALLRKLVVWCLAGVLLLAVLSLLLVVWCYLL